MSLTLLPADAPHAPISIPSIRLLHLSAPPPLLLRLLLPSRDPPLRPHAPKHQPHTHPLPRPQAMPKPQHAQQHRQHLPRHGHRHQQQATKLRQRHVDEDLAHGATRREAQHVGEHGRVGGQEGQRVAQLAGRGGRDVERGEEGGREQRQDEQVGGCEGGGEDVLRGHHLRAGVGPVGGEDVVLRRVREAVEQEVDGEEEQAPCVVAFRRRRGGGGGGVFFCGGGRVPEREDRHARRHQRDDDVLVQRVRPPEERHVQEHDGQQLARLGEDEGHVVDVRERGVAEGGG